VKFGGHTTASTDERGRYHVRWIPETQVKGIAYDTPIAGYRVGTCNSLRLWKAEAVESFDFEAFNHGDYDRAVEDKVRFGDNSPRCSIQTTRGIRARSCD
jgi:starch phosphorylase